MTRLISAVGDSDPIRNFYDGPLLHIARVYQPEKIVLIHSERSIIKHEKIIKSIKSIAGYSPEIIQDETVLKNDEVFIFDTMNDRLSKIIDKYNTKYDDTILNLSSGTPQMISAMFAINRISDLHVTAVQVATPNNSSNEGTPHDSQEDIDILIETNQDHQSDFVNRTRQDEGTKFSQSLTKRNLETLIDHYDYLAASNLASSYPDWEIITNKLNHLVSLRHDIKQPNTVEQVALFRNNLILDEKLGLYRDFIVKVEAIYAHLLEKRFSELFDKQIEEVFNYSVGYPSFKAAFISEVTEKEYLGKTIFHKDSNLSKEIDLASPQQITRLLYKSSHFNVKEIDFHLAFLANVSSNVRNAIAHTMRQSSRQELEGLINQSTIQKGFSELFNQVMDKRQRRQLEKAVNSKGFNEIKLVDIIHKSEQSDFEFLSPFYALTGNKKRLFQLTDVISSISYLTKTLYAEIPTNFDYYTKANQEIKKLL